MQVSDRRQDLGRMVVDGRRLRSEMIVRIAESGSKGRQNDTDPK